MSRTSLISLILLLTISVSCQNFFWSHTKIENKIVVEYGLLYNYYAAKDVRNITSSNDWVLPSLAQARVLSDYLGIDGNYTNDNDAGTPMKEIGTVYWGISGGTNTSQFNGRGSGSRSSAGLFQDLKDVAQHWTSDAYGSLGARMILSSATDGLSTKDGFLNGKSGNPIRLLYVGAGLPTEYVGNDGKVYRVVTIGTQTWLADNLCETRFRNGDVIPWHGANPANFFTNAEWAALTTAGVCAYDNDVNNVAAGFTFPTP